MFGEGPLEDEDLLELEEKKAKQAALRYLNYRPRTKEEVRRYLLGKGFQIDLVEKVITRIEGFGYLNDRQFAQNWIEQRLRTKQRGKRVLSEELKQKGIAAEIIETEIANINEQEEWQACLQALQKKIRIVKERDRYRQRIKVSQFLLRRGYSYELIQRVWSHVEKNNARDE